MRFLDLHLKAFGPFTDYRLDLSGGEQGLHVIFGPNEAGKSSTLRALKNLLYGFPARSEDDFLHPKDQLRVGARLRFADHSEVEVVRRKGNKATLLAPGDEETPLDEALLNRCLQGIDEKLFSSLFGLTHEALVEGGKELLTQKGDIGQALFAAGLGTRNLRKVLQDLDSEAEALFLPRGSKPRINLGIAEYRDAKKALSDLSLSGREWDGKRKDLEKRREESAGIERDLAALKAERNRLWRIRRVQAPLGERRELLCRRDELVEVVRLPADFPDRRRKTREAIRAAVETVTRAEAELGELRQEAAALMVSQSILDQAETIERLHQGVQLHTKGIADHSRLLGERSEQRAVAENLLDEIRPGLTVEEAEALRPALEHWLRIQELGNQRQALWNERTQARRELGEAERVLTAAQSAVTALTAQRDPASLRRCLDAARKPGDLDRTLLEAADLLRRDEEQLRVDLRRLGPIGHQGTLEELEALPIPNEETVRRFQEGFDTLAARRRALDGLLRTSRDELADLERRLEEIRLGGSVPTEEELAEARVRRDQAWLLVRRAWLEKKVEGEADPAAYERSVDEADDLADRLRREVGRVQEQAQLLARRDQLRRAIDNGEVEDARVVDKEEELKEDWKILWHPCGVDPLPPREMHPGWTTQYEKLRARAEAWRTQRHRIETLRGTRTGHRAALVCELERLGESAFEGEALEPVLARSEERVRVLEQEAAERVRISASLRDAEARLVEARKAEAEALASLKQWEENWGDTIQGLGVGRDALPSQVLQIVETLRKAFVSLGDAAKLDRRIGGLERDLETYRASVRALEHQVAPDIAGRPAEQTVVEFQSHLTEARRHSDRREVLDRRIRKLEEEIRGAEATRRSMEDNLALLVQEAGCTDASGLEEAERLSLQLQDLVRDLERAERQQRQGGRRVRVENMSEGVRDQLYLALRLATLERYLAQAEPLPFIVDDILIKFDDERSEATLRVLADLATKTQVILFTHHASLRDLAAELKNGAEVFVRELG